MTKIQIENRLQKHYNAALEKYGKNAVLGVFLYGSQNYGVDTEFSDVDTKCILVPNVYHLAINPYQTKHLSIDGEVCECMTIMHMIDNWKKQNPNFLEIMFTKYKIINPDYYNIWNNVVDNWKESIARYDIKKGVLSISYQALNPLKRGNCTGKQAASALRLHFLLENWVTQKFPYETCLQITDSNIKNTIKELKTGNLSFDEDFELEMSNYFLHRILQAEKIKEDETFKQTVNEYAFKPLIMNLIYRREEIELAQEAEDEKNN